MNVLKPDLQVTIKTLLGKGLSQREIERKTGIDRKTIRRYAQSTSLMGFQETEHSKSPTQHGVATGEGAPSEENPPPWPPAQKPDFPKHVRSACETHREWIQEQVKLGRNAMAIYQDLMELFSFTHRYNSVKRFVRGLKRQDPQHRVDTVKLIFVSILVGYEDNHHHGAVPWWFLPPCLLKSA